MADTLELAVAGPRGPRKVRMSNPGKVYFPERGFTKRQVVEYYLAVSEPLLRAIGDRPTTLKRLPGGVAGEPFCAKRVPKGAPERVSSAEITFPSGRTARQVWPGEPAVVAWAVGLGTLEFHPWPVRAADTDHPDELRIDLDPQPGTCYADAVRVAEVVREVLDDAGMVGWPKTSGGRGIHVRVRLAAHWDFVRVRRAVIALAREVQRRVPDLATVDWWKADRGERVFLDFNQAARDRTVASAWSLRDTSRATVRVVGHRGAGRLGPAHGPRQRKGAHVFRGGPGAARSSEPRAAGIRISRRRARTVGARRRALHLERSKPASGPNPHSAGMKPDATRGHFLAKSLRAAPGSEALALSQMTSYSSPRIGPRKP